MDYKEKYEELVEAARAVVEGNPGLCNMNKRLCRVRDLLPEKESDDEKIRKEIIEFIDWAESHGSVRNDWHQKKRPAEWIAYLEKQKEQKPNIELIQKSWYLEGYHDGKYNNESKWLIQIGKEGPKYEENQKYGTQKPAEWSKEDERNLYNAIEAIKYTFDVSEGSGGSRLITWLKSRLRPQPHWKPSKEQIGALERAIIKMHTPTDIDILAELRDNLKKL